MNGARKSPAICNHLCFARPRNLVSKRHRLAQFWLTYQAVKVLFGKPA